MDMEDGLNNKDIDNRKTVKEKEMEHNRKVGMEKDMENGKTGRAERLATEQAMEKADQNDRDEHSFGPMSMESSASRGGHYVDGGFVDSDGVFRPFFGCKMCCTVRLHAALSSFQFLPIQFNISGKVTQLADQ